MIVSKTGNPIYLSTEGLHLTPAEVSIKPAKDHVGFCVALHSSQAKEFARALLNAAESQEYVCIHLE